MSNKIIIDGQESNFEDILPRSIFSESDVQRLDKSASTFTGASGAGWGGSGMSGQFGHPAAYTGNSQVYRNPSRRFYDPEITTTAIYLPRNVKQKNRWRRWFYDHDEVTGPVLDLHSELPYSKAEFNVEDLSIQRHVEDCLERTNFFAMLPVIDLEYLKIGEVFIHTPWNDSLGMWDQIIIHNPDYIEVKFSPFADQEAVIELVPDDELKSIIHSTKPEEQQLKRKLPADLVKRVLSGKNIILDPEETTHIARRSNPYDIRGTSIIDRMFRLLMYEDKLREAQITIADNFIYPLKIFKLGDPQKGWIPNETHQKALAQMLQQATFDPNFSLIYHYGLNVDYVTVADKVMRLEKEWTEINAKKMVALGVSQQFMNGEATYASANVALQTQLARYKAKRDLFEIKWMINKFFRIMAKRNGWYKRDKREIVNNFRVSRSDEELQNRLVVPEIRWHKHLMMRDDQAHLTFLNNVYAQGKGPVSAITLLMSMGLDLEDELRKKKKTKELEEQVGTYIQPPVQVPGAPGLPPGGTPKAAMLDRIKSIFKYGKKDEIKKIIETSEKSIDIPEEFKAIVREAANEFTGVESHENEYLNAGRVLEKEKDATIKILDELTPSTDKQWQYNLNSPNIPTEVAVLLTSLDNKLISLNKKYASFGNESISAGLAKEGSEITKSLIDLYLQGKLTSYSWTGFLPIYEKYYSNGNGLKDYSDIVLTNQFEDWVNIIKDNVKTSELVKNHIRNLGNTCYAHGQLKGFQEQGISNVKIGNVLFNDGIRYTVDDLLSKGMHLGSLISPQDEIIIFSACIEGFDDDNFGNYVDPQIVRYRSATVDSIEIENCPIEYLPIIKKFVSRLGKYLKEKYTKISFVTDVVDTPEWEAARIKEVIKENGSGKDASFGASSQVSFEKLQKKGKVATFTSGKILYISSWLGMEDVPFIDNLLRYVDYETSSLKKAVDKNFTTTNYNLSKEELETYTVLHEIEPIYDNEDRKKGYRLSNLSNQRLPLKLKEGKLWNNEGNCLKIKDKDNFQIFKDNLKLWIDFPHLLDEEMLKAFNGI